ncbi:MULTISPECIES: SDR family oxidoreductase [Vibrio]|jgi:NAD(P)H dehydrogenase (quinone)|uniref:SDR family oxidoreductase n=1 Tax=Vibrio TaxID=662 RepID=UPI00031EF76C|nr:MULTISPECIES: SDR family oxidoreductase [Vibrio]OEE86929.1 NAD(P)-dependent oxidoreductase [Vibrio crassostreae 9ZC88]PML74608.1 NAD(P)-dependent oxidoreductase [Vibrio sp. 10N.261.51.A7]
MKIAVTAASGKLGSAIVEATVKLTSKNQVVALARTPERAFGLGVEVRPGDYEDAEQLEQSLQGVDVVLLVSGMDAPDKRIGQHRNVIEAAKKAGVRKIVYTSVQGAEENTAFSPVIQSNRQTERDVRESGLEWVNGRNGIYIEPDIEYIDSYKKAGGIFNCAGEGQCGYTTREELGYAYARMLVEDIHNGNTYNLHGDAITQAQLTDYMNSAFGTNLTFTSMSVEEYRLDRVAELGDFIGTVIAGIYQGILEGKSDNPSHFEQAAGRKHVSWQDYFSELKSHQ